MLGGRGDLPSGLDADRAKLRADVSRDDFAAAMAIGASDMVRVLPEIRDLLPLPAAPNSQDDSPAARFRF
jgi:hypothetical protein